MASIDVGVVGIEALLVLTLGAGIWKAGNLRSEIVENYQTRHDTSLARLEDQSVRILSDLATRFSESIGGVDGEPGGSTRFNPAELKPDIDFLAKTLKSHSRLPVYFRFLLRAGPILTFSMSLTLVSILITFAYLSGLDHSRASCISSLWCICAFVFVSLVDVIAYFVTLQFFTNAELLPSRTSGK